MAEYLSYTNMNSLRSWNLIYSESGNTKFPGEEKQPLVISDSADIRGDSTSDLGK